GGIGRVHATSDCQDDLHLFGHACALEQARGLFRPAGTGKHLAEVDETRRIVLRGTPALAKLGFGGRIVASDEGVVAERALWIADLASRLCERRRGQRGGDGGKDSEPHSSILL